MVGVLFTCCGFDLVVLGVVGWCGLLCWLDTLGGCRGCCLGVGLGVGLGC